MALKFTNWFACARAFSKNLLRTFALVKTVAASAGVYTDAHTGQTYPRLQLYTLAEYFAGLRPKVPLLDRQAAAKRAAVQDDGYRQGSLSI